MKGKIRYVVLTVLSAAVAVTGVVEVSGASDLIEQNVEIGLVGVGAVLSAFGIRGISKKDLDKNVSKWQNIIEDVREDWEDESNA